MVKVSHARCRQCGQARHRNAKFNLCRSCWSRKKGEVISDWHAIKARRAAKRTNGLVHATEATPAPQLILEEETALPGGRRSSLTAEQEHEIVNLYTTTNTPLHEIAETYGIGDTTPFRILSKHGVAWRRGDTEGRVLPPHIEAMKEVHVAPTPAPRSIPSIEGKPVSKVSEPVSEPVSESVPTLVETTADILADLIDDALPRWAIELRAAVIVHAASAGAAIARAEALGYSTLDVDVVRRLA